MPLRSQFTFLPRVRKAIYLVVFGLYFAGAVSFLFVPSPAVQSQGQTVLTIWHGFLLVGGLVSTVGVIMDKKYIEISGLPLLCSALLAYAVVLVDDLIKAGMVNGPAIGVGCILLAAMGCLVDRGVSLWGWIRLSDALTQQYRSEDAEEDG